MAVLTILQTADYWVGAGGPSSRAVEFVAIGMAESSLDTLAVSPVGARGVWQIMPFNAAPNGASVAGLFDPAVNALVAVRMSGHGANCAAWDTCYANIRKSGRYPFLAAPEPGSAADGNMLAVAAVLGHDKLGGAAPPMPATGLTSMAPVLAHLQMITQRFTPQVARVIVAGTMATRSVGRNGWRP
jgi:soluble lytic murein transglycosylase-like protein